MDDIGRQHRVDELDNPHDDEWRLLARLDDDRVADRQRRDDFAARVDGRPVGGDDGANNAKRLEHDRNVNVAFVVEFVRQLVDEAAEEAEDADQEIDVLQLGVGDRLSVLERLEGRQFVGVLFEERGALDEQRATLGSVAMAPVVLERRMGGAHGPVHLLCAVTLDVGDDLAVGGVLDRELRLGIVGKPAKTRKSIRIVHQVRHGYCPLGMPEAGALGFLETGYCRPARILLPDLAQKPSFFTHSVLDNKVPLGNRDR